MLRCLEAVKLDKGSVVNLILKLYLVQNARQGRKTVYTSGVS
jgi:hypothetical protein